MLTFVIIDNPTLVPEIPPTVLGAVYSCHHNMHTGFIHIGNDQQSSICIVSLLNVVVDREKER